MPLSPSGATCGSGRAAWTEGRAAGAGGGSSWPTKMKDEELVRGWIEHFRSGSEELSPAYIEMEDAVQDDPERAWQLILAILRQDQSDSVISCLAGGPLEDLLVYHGAELIDRVEKLAQIDQDFSRLFGGVWRNDIPDEVWRRVASVRRETW